MPPTPERPLRVAFLSMGGANWIAGTYYLKNILLAIRSLGRGAPVESTLLVPKGTPTDNSDGLVACADRVLPLPRRAFWELGLLELQRRLGRALGPEPRLAAYLRQHQVDAIFRGGEFGPQFKLPLLGWIPDFQHVRLPEMFSARELRSRDQEFSRVAAYSTRVIVSSRDVHRDFQRFAPHAAHKARVMPFVAQVPPDLYDTDCTQVCNQYGLPRSFFYLPNQFWKHKNHTVVVEALRLLRARQKEITVVCSGRTLDDRHPRYFPELQDRVRALGLRSSMIILGVVPHSHVFQLMRQCVAVLQPSLFEGWSTSVEEVKSVGKRILLSDIPVHREQGPSQAVFFDPHDAEALARGLITTLADCAPGPDLELEATARSRLALRTMEFGENFAAIVREATQR